MQRYEEYQDSPTTMAKQPWLLKEEPMLLLNSNTRLQMQGYCTKNSASTTMEQQKHLANEMSSKYKTLQNFQLNIGPFKTQEIKQSPRDKH